MTITKFIVYSGTVGMACWAQSAEQRLKRAADVLSSTLSKPDSGIPADLLGKARCVVVVPGMKEGETFVDAQNGKGFATCRLEGVGWSAPASVKLEGGNFGMQAGASETAVVMLMMKEGAADTLFSGKYTLGSSGNAVMEGPVGRAYDPRVGPGNWPAILGYSHSGGVLSGSKLEGATIRPDAAGNKQLYGTGNLTYRQILKGSVKTPSSAQWLAAELNKYIVTSPSPPPLNAESLPAARWNNWIEEQNNSTPFIPSFVPVTALTPNSQYTLVVDLSAFAYAKQEEGVIAQLAGNQLMDWINDKAKTIKSVTLEAVLIPDPGYFLASPERARKITIELDKMRTYFAGKQTHPTNPFEILKFSPTPDFQFGRVPFTVNTGPHEGLGFLGVSIWTKGMFPLDEISIPVCISKSGKTDGCTSVAKATRSRSHGDALNAAPLVSETDLPAAAFHFIEFDDARGVGVFRRNEWPDGQYETWSMSQLSKQLAGFTKILLLNFDTERSEEALAQTGFELYNLLVPASEEAARREFESFVARRAKLAAAPPAQPPPQILVRMAPLDPANAFALPLAMMTVPVEGTRRFIGDLFRVHSPLPAQDYRPLEACISRWVMVMPPKENQSPSEFVSARQELEEWTDACKPSGCLSTLKKYADWIGQTEPKSKEPEPTALLLLSHYENQSLTWDRSSYFSAFAIHKSFAQPSVAVINSCGAAAPGEDSLLRKLNEFGFQTVVATTTKVHPIMAGKYFNLLAQALKLNRNTPAYTVSRAHFDAVQQLKKQSLPGTGELPFGSKAHIYSLLGNGNLSLCPLTAK